MANEPTHYIIEPEADGPHWLVIEQTTRDEWCTCTKKDHAIYTALLLNTSVQQRALKWKSIILYIIPTPFTGAAKA